MSRQMEIDFNVEETKKKNAKLRLNDLWAESQSQRVAELANSNIKREIHSRIDTAEFKASLAKSGSNAWPERR